MGSITVVLEFITRRIVIPEVILREVFEGVGITGTRTTALIKEAVKIQENVIN